MVTSNVAARARFISDTPRFKSNKELAIAVWVTRTGELAPLQATGGWLIPPDYSKK
jgi:hypothetical protein